VLPTTLVQTAAPAPTAVLGETLVQGAELPRTGSAHLPAMLALAFGLILSGIALLAGSRRRVGSASFPG
jgi:LPXTG-motif cell wall-anchored protein